MEGKPFKPVLAERSLCRRAAIGHYLEERKSNRAIYQLCRDEQFGESVWCETYISSV